MTAANLQLISNIFLFLGLGLVILGESNLPPFKSKSRRQGELRVPVLIGMVLAAVGALGNLQASRQVLGDAQSRIAHERGRWEAKIEALQKEGRTLKRKACKTTRSPAPKKKIVRTPAPKSAPKKKVSRAVAPRPVSTVSRRSLSGAAKAGFVVRVRKHRGKSVRVVSVQGDFDSYNFAITIKQALKEAGWRVEGVIKRDLPSSVTGLNVLVATQTPPVRADDLAAAFKKAGFAVAGHLNPSQGPDVVEVIVGAKP